MSLTRWSWFSGTQVIQGFYGETRKANKIKEIFMVAESTSISSNRSNARRNINKYINIIDMYYFIIYIYYNINMK